MGGAWRFFPPLRCTESHQDMSNHRSYTHNLGSCANKARKKKIQANCDDLHVFIYFAAVQILDILYVFICTIEFLHSRQVVPPRVQHLAGAGLWKEFPAIVKANDLV